ncbi:Myb-like_DNA-binding domain-containing protein [Hexamita inflata]|uniref:Myb-like DNA-binding domain-containing protein n=1 Tax=Hexamita inflata TaxID=28002 RepID=A0AA86TVY0_9EUKA|nr:Myb-like DNA-binding domain-containing protein [Hexamita inflata]
MQKQNIYDFWTEEEQLRLLQAIQQTSANKSYIDWKSVEVLMKQRTRQQCKSFYQSFQRKQQECVDEWIANNIRFKEVSWQNKIIIYAYATFYKFDWEFLQTQYFPEFTVEKIKELYDYTQKMLHYQQQILGSLQKSIVLQLDSKTLLRVKEMYNHIVQAKHYLELNESIQKGEQISKQFYANELFLDAPLNPALIDQVDIILGVAYRDLCKGYDLDLIINNFKHYIEGVVSSSESRSETK